MWKSTHAGLGGWFGTGGSEWVWGLGPSMSHTEGMLVASKPQRLYWAEL